MFRLISLTSLIVAVAVMTSVSAYGDLIAYDGFDYTAASSVVGQNGGSGWSGAWLAKSTDTYTASHSTIQSAEMVSGGGSYLGVVGESGVVGNSVLYRNLGATYTSGSLYVSFVAQQTNDLKRMWGLRLGNYTVSTETWSYTSNTLGEAIMRKDTDDASYGIYGGGNDDTSGVAPTVMKLVVGEYDLDTGEINLYLLDPTAAYPASIPATPDATLTVGDMGDIDAIQLFTGGNPGNYPYNYADVNYDELRIGTTWSDVVPVPEPSTLALFVSGLIGLLAYAWRKR